MAEGEQNRRRPSPYMIAVGLIFASIVAVAAISTLTSNDDGVLGLNVEGRGRAVAEFAVPDVRSELTGDANIAQDDCASSTRPCPAEDRRTPACRIEGEGVIRICDLFDRPAVLSFWFTRGGNCEGAQDAFDAAHRRFRDRVAFLGVNVRDPRERVRELIEERGLSHPIGLDADGALSNLYRIGGCPSFLYVYPGGILQSTSIGELDPTELSARIRTLIEESRQRAAG